MNSVYNKINKILVNYATMLKNKKMNNKLMLHYIYLIFDALTINIDKTLFVDFSEPGIYVQGNDKGKIYEMKHILKTNIFDDFY